MPAYTRNIKRDRLVFVPVNTIILYGFKTKDLAALGGVSAADVTALGHITAAAATAAAGKICVVGAAAPKPPRVRKALSNAAAGTQKSVSSYCSKTALGAALAAGWSLAKAGYGVTLRPANAQSGTLTAIATLSNGAKYCFPMNKGDFDSYSGALGLESAAVITTATERDSLVRGSTTPYPGRASIRTASGASFSTFFSSSASVTTEGFNVLTEEIVITNPAGGGGG